MGSRRVGQDWMTFTFTFIVSQVAFGLKDRHTLSDKHFHFQGNTGNSFCVYDKLDFLCPSTVMDSGFSSFLTLHIQSPPGNRWAQNWARRALASTASSNKNFKNNLSHCLLNQFCQSLLFRYSTFIWLQHCLDKERTLSSHPPKNWKRWCFQGNTVASLVAQLVKNSSAMQETLV